MYLYYNKYHSVACRVYKRSVLVNRIVIYDAQSCSRVSS